jgi:hypothetical protein
MTVRIESPYEGTNGLWLRGNMHAHSTASDGSRDPRSLVEAYASRGYDWLCISDHDKITPAPKEIPEGFVVLTGNEITDKGPHILHVGTATTVTPLPDRNRVIQEAADAGGVCVLNHPNWEKSFNHWSQAHIEALPRLFDGIEIYNGITRRQEGSCYATDRWDQLLSKHIHAWGYANDDTHKDVDLALGWNRVQCKSYSGEEIVKGLKTGCFYSSTGVEFCELRSEGTRIRMVSTNGSLCVPVVDWGLELGHYPGRSWEFDLEKLPGDARPSYIRFEVLGDMGRRAWTQPIFLAWT